MSSGSDRARNNVRAGIFVTAGIVLAFVVIVALSDLGSLLTPRSAYQIRFTVAGGVDGLAPGSPVRIGGLDRGRVTGITPEVVDGRVAGMLVGIEIDQDIALFDNARADRITALIGNASSINFSDVGSPDGGTKVAPGSTLSAAASTSGALGKIIGDEASTRVASVIRNIDELLVEVRSDYKASISPAIRRLDQALADAEAVLESIRNDYPGWSEQVTSTLTEVESAATKLDPAFEEARAMISELRGAIDDARAGIADVRSAVSDNRPKVDEIVENVRVATGDAKAIAARVREETMDKVDAILGKGQSGIDSFTGLVERVRGEFDLQVPKLDLILSDARLTSQQLKLASIEVRRSPWRLLYRPTTEELEHELLYEAARSFALAAGDLQATSQSLDSMLTRHGGALGVDPALGERLRQMLESSLRRYGEAQSALFTIILEDGERLGQPSPGG